MNKKSNKMSTEKGAPDNVFEVFGYFEEFIIDGKMIGCKNYIGEFIDESKREVGYHGTKHFVAESDIKFDNKKVIKKGQNYYTRVYPFCGKKR